MASFTDGTCVRDASKAYPVSLKQQNHSPVAKLSWDQDTLNINKWALDRSYPRAFDDSFNLRTDDIVRKTMDSNQKDISLKAPTSSSSGEEVKAYYQAVKDMKFAARQIAEGDVVQWSNAHQTPTPEVWGIMAYLDDVLEEVDPLGNRS